MPTLTVKRKWRPSLALVILLVCAALVTLPVVGVLSARMSSNQFARETERSLLAQAAIFAEVFAAELPKDMVAGHKLSEEQIARRAETYTPIEPRLDLFRDSIHPPRPDPLPAAVSVGPDYFAAAETLGDLARSTQKRTLAGYHFLDFKGHVITGSGSESGNFSQIPEVATALSGETATVLRFRTETDNSHLLSSISRNTGYRVFVAQPVVAEDHVVGVVYISRTPMDLRKFLFQERHTLGMVAGIMLLVAAGVGMILWRLISKPIHDLSMQSQHVANGRQTLPDPITHFGVRELADLGGSVAQMAASLSDRSTAIETYTKHVTHELKSPVTAILGAAELLAHRAEQSPRHQKLIANIQAEGHRMNALLGRLRELASASIQQDRTPVLLREIFNHLEQPGPVPKLSLKAPSDLRLPMSLEQGQIVFYHLVQNAREHGATEVLIKQDQTTGAIFVQDNGHGISNQNLTQVTTPFFTTRRANGGTGMGLAIVEAVLKQTNGHIEAVPNEGGACFRILFEEPI